MERLKVTKEIEVAEQHDELPLAEFTNKFLKLAGTIPEQYLGNAVVEMESYYDYCKLIIKWQEPEPEKEFQRRLKTEADNLKRAEAAERKQYEALKKKFEGEV